jgi:hypothetical protein
MNFVECSDSFIFVDSGVECHLDCSSATLEGTSSAGKVLFAFVTAFLLLV